MQEIPKETKPEIKTPTPPSTQNNVEQISSVIVKFVNDVDTKQLSKVVDALVTPFQKHARQTRRDVLLVIGLIILVMIGVLAWLTFAKIIDSNYLIFFLATVVGYLMGFLTKFFIPD